MTLRSLILCVLICTGTHGWAQQQDPYKLIQFSGVVVSGDSLTPVPFSSLMIKNSSHGTVADYYGFFSLVARPGDTIRFSSLGYRPEELVIPDTLSDSRYSMIMLLKQDTFTLKEAVVYPWPSKEQFRQAFLSLNAPDDDAYRAFKNMSRDEVRLALQGVPMSSQGNYNYQMQQQAVRLYNMGQIPSISLLNPLAWAQFINAWKRGDFKNDR